MNYKEKVRIFRDKFYGRQDVYAYQWQKEKDGNIIKGYTPACSNHWKERCNLRLKVSSGCSNCEIKAFTPVSDDTVLSHIRGEEPQMHYMLQVDGTIKFAAFDFDYKPGKEDKGYTFEDAKKVIAVLREWDMPYGIARSTGNGFHIYFFFEDYYSANRFRSVMLEIMDRCGFLFEDQNGIRPLPEMFPKQNYVSSGGLGNGIKPPMIETSFSKERNCFVQDDGSMIPAEEQWTHLDSIQKLKSKFLDDLIEKFNIPIQADLSYSNGKSDRQRRSSSGPVNGSIEKVVEGCAAFRKMRRSMEAGQVPGHFEGMALWHASMNTLDGKDWFINSVPGWGKDSQGMRQLEHSLDKGYTPWTCKKMQEQGVCAIGTKCFDKRPPIDIVEGRPVVRTDVPESEWPEPSPIRYAFGKGEDFLQKLIAEADLLSSITDLGERAQRVKDIILRASVFDEAQQAVLKDHLVDSKIGKRSDIKKWMGEASSNRTKKANEASLERMDTIVVNNTIFRLINPYGYSFLKPGGKKGEPIEEVIGTFFIDILEERTIVEDSKTKRKTFYGEFTSRTVKTHFEIETDAWFDGGEFYRFFGKVGGAEFNFNRANVDLLRQVVQHTAQMGREGVPSCKKTMFFGIQGWYEGAYLMPSAIVDKDGIKPNTERPVDNSNKELASKIDFKLMTEGDFREVLFHIRNDMFKAFPRDCVMFGIGFSMIASVHDYLDLRSKPTLWFDGTTGHGKSTLAELLQCFYGDFKNFLSWQAGPTAKAVMDYMNQFKDCVFLADDFKGMDKREDSALKAVVQSSYDGSVRSALDKTGKQRGDVMSRCLLIISGEELPQGHASVIARTVTISYTPLNRDITTPFLNKCLEYKGSYSGVTARFVHWVLNQSKASIQKEYNDINNQIHKSINGKQNSSRIAKNIALVTVGWNCFTRFMLDSGIIEATEAKKLIDEFWGYAEVVRDQMAIRCAEEQTLNIFLNKVQELLMTGEIYIENLEGLPESQRAKKVGFIDKKDAEPDVVYIWPETIIESVKNSMTNPLTISKHSASAQLQEGGYLAKTPKEGGYTVMKRYNNLENKRVWAIKLSMLGFIDKPRIVGSTVRMQLDSPLPDAEGLI